MSNYNQGVGGGYPYHTTTPGMNPTQNYGTTGMTNQTYPQGGDGGSYVLPPQNTNQSGYGTGTGMGTGMGTHGHGLHGTGMGAAGMAGTGTGTGMGTHGHGLPGTGMGAAGLAGTGAGMGTRAGMGTGTGMGTGAGMGTRAGMGTGTGTGTGMGTGAGMGTGTGMGTGMGTGTGMGAGTGMQGIVGQQFVSPTVQSFAVAKKKLSVSKGDWNITDQTGATVFTVDGRIASMRDRRFLRDSTGAKILTMKKKLVTMHDTWQICMGDNDNVIASCKKSSLVQFRTSMDVMLASSPTGNHTPDYQLKGDFFDRNVTVFRGAEQAALVTRQITFTSAILGKDTFGVTIFPGVDFALVLALIVIMDEVFLHDNGDSD